MIKYWRLKNHILRRLFNNAIRIRLYLKTLCKQPKEKLCNAACSGLALEVKMNLINMKELN